MGPVVPLKPPELRKRPVAPPKPKLLQRPESGPAADAVAKPEISVTASFDETAADAGESGDEPPLKSDSGQLPSQNPEAPVLLHPVPGEPPSRSVTPTPPPSRSPTASPLRRGGAPATPLPPRPMRSLSASPLAPPLVRSRSASPVPPERRSPVLVSQVSVDSRPPPRAATFDTAQATSHASVEWRPGKGPSAPAALKPGAPALPLRPGVDESESESDSDRRSIASSSTSVGGLSVRGSMSAPETPRFLSEPFIEPATAAGGPRPAPALPPRAAPRPQTEPPTSAAAPAPAPPASLSWSPPPSLTASSAQADFERRALDAKHVNSRPPATGLVEPAGRKDLTALYADSEYTVLGSWTGLSVYSTPAMTSLWSGTQRVSAVARFGGSLVLGLRDGGVATVDAEAGFGATVFTRAHTSRVYGVWVADPQVLTLSVDGKLNVWTSLAADAMPTTYRVVSEFAVATYAAGRLWIAKRKRLHLYAVRVNASGETTMQTVRTAEWRPPAGAPGGSVANTVGDFSCIHANTDQITCGHSDGSVSAYSAASGEPLYSFMLTRSALISTERVGDQLWFGSKNGSIYVVDISTARPVLLKEWKASLNAAPVSLLRNNGAGNVLSVADLAVKIWEAALTRDSQDLAMREHLNATATLERVRTRIFSWNVDACIPTKLDSAQIATALGLDEPPEAWPEVIAVGLQEVVELENKTKTVSSILNTADPDLSQDYEAWKQFFSGFLLADGYQLVASKSLVGLYTCLFVKAELVTGLSDLQTTTVKTGMGGRYGNKGGTLFSLKLFSSTVCFINCHLAAGHTAIIQRNHDADSILSRRAGVVDDASSSSSASLVSESSAAAGLRPMDHDFCFFFGDTNYRINTARELAIKYISNGDWASLYARDQLAGQLAKNPTLSLARFNEHAIDFAPTYKFDRGSDAYDTGSKKRIPAWCDRILYRGSGVAVGEYTTLRTYASDHRPVTGLYTFAAPRFTE